MTQQPFDPSDSSRDPSGSGAVQPEGTAKPSPGPQPHPWGQPPADPGYSQPPWDGQPAAGTPGYPPPASGYGQPSPGQGYQQPQYGQQYPPPGYPPAQQYPGQPPTPRQQPPLSVSDEKLWSTLSHISVPFVGFVGPLVAYLLFKDRGPFVRANAIESLNFSILYTVAVFACSILTGIGIGAILLPIVFIGALILAIMAAVAANKGQMYSYPVNWRLIK